MNFFFTAHLYIKQFSFNNRVIIVADLTAFYRIVGVSSSININISGCRLHTSTPELRLNPMSSDELQISYQHNFKFLISLFRGFSAPLSPVLTLHTQKNTKIKNIGI